VVIDVKTGMQVVEAITSEQLQALAFMVARSMGYSGSVETRISKVNEDGTVDSNFHTITPEELSILELKFKGLRNKVLDNLNRYKTNEPLDLRESDHCKWCACAKHCPLKNAEPCLYIREDVEETK